MKKTEFFRSVVLILSGNVGAQLILVAVSPLVTRIYTPSDFGILSAFTSLATVLLVVSRLRYEAAIPLPRIGRIAEELVAISLFLNLVFSIIILISVGFFRKEISVYMGVPELSIYLWLLPLCILTAGTYRTFTFWGVRRKEYRKLATTRVLQSIANAVIQLLGGLLLAGPTGLLMGFVAGQSAGALNLSRGFDFSHFSRLGNVFGAGARAVLKRYQKFPTYDLAASALNSIGSQLPNFLLVILFGAPVAGLYLLSERVLAMPMTTIGRAVAQVLYGESAERLRTKRLYSATINILLILSVIMIIPCLIIFVFGEEIFKTVFGRGWEEAGMYASVLVVGIFFRSLYPPISMVYLTVNAQDENFLIQIISTAAKALALYAGYQLQSAYMAILFFSIMNAITYIYLILRALIRTRRLERVQVSSS